MKFISKRDFSALQRAILALHSPRDLMGFRAAVPRIFMDLVPAEFFALGDFRVDLEKRAVCVLNVWESRPTLVGEMLETAERNLFEHPFMQHALRHGPSPGAMRLSDFLTLRQLRGTRLYRELLAPTGVGRLMAIHSSGGPGMATLSLMRPETSTDFSERDRTMLEMLTPHFAQARANLERESSLRASRSRSLKGIGFTPREIEVSLWLAEGKTNHELAVILATPVRTIEKHVERILHKLGTRHRAAAALLIAEATRAGRP